MENATDALKMAFAVLIFVIALTLVFSLFSQVKETADSVLFYSDKSNYYDMETIGEGTKVQGRIVGEAAIISALHKQKEEQTYITIKMKNGTSKTFTQSSKTEEKTQYINTNLSEGDRTFKENTIEVVTGGTYKTAEDGTRVTIIPGTVKVYITYSEM